ncbi:hypothetical protein OQA88_4992 [Cercophora sp. LCS_1]
MPRSTYEDSTPPDTGVQLPLTPPATDERPTRNWDACDPGKVMQMFKAFRDRASLEQRPPLAELRVSPPQYQELLKGLGDEQALAQYVDDKVRFDYDPTKSLLTIRMPSPVHEFFTTLLTNEIRDQLKRITERECSAGEFAAMIEDGRSSRIFLREDISDESPGAAEHVVRREPDGQFQHCHAAYPGVVLEVSYSQDGKDLKKLASDYILRSNGDIKTVIGIDINYGNESTVSLWRPNYIEEEGEEFDILEVKGEILYQPFRSSGGSPAGYDECLELRLSDFASDEISDGSREMECESRGIKSRRRTRKRKPSSSPADELRSEDEAKYRRQESDVAERAAVDDEEYERPGRKRRT